MGRSAKSLLSRWVDSQYTTEELDRIKALPTRQNEYGYDPFGFNREEAIDGIYLTWLFYKYYFRAEAHDIGNVPPGRVLLIANHAGQFAWDGAMLTIAMLLDAAVPRI